MLVSDLIQHLKTLPQDAPVAYSKFSEYVLLESGDIRAQRACVERPDGWVQRERPDMPSVEYVMFPGN